MDTTTYICNVYLKNGKPLCQHIFEIIVKTDKFIVKYNDSDKDLTCTISKYGNIVFNNCDFITFSINEGLMLDGVGVGMNIFNYDEEIYKRHHIEASKSLILKLKGGYYDEVEQWTSNSRIVNNNGIIYLDETAEKHGIHSKPSVNGNITIVTYGSFKNLLKVLNAKCSKPIIDIKNKVEPKNDFYSLTEDSNFTFTNDRKNNKYDIILS
jgi:hypothetical protein